MVNFGSLCRASSWQTFTLEPEARSQLSEEFREGGASVDLSKFTKPFTRRFEPAEVNLEPLERIVDAAMDKFSSSPVESDAWLAPRVHSTLRLTRREAADAGIWNFLAVIGMPEYVRWRWGSDEIAETVRFVGPEYKQAELTRDGSDYSHTPLLFANQDLQNSWARCDLFHHRPTAIASLKFLSTFNGGSFATSDQIRQLVKGFNMVLTTTIVDSLCANPALDAESMCEWCGETVDETRMLDAEPEGPLEDRVPSESVEAVMRLLEHTAEVTTFSKRDRSAGRRESDTARA